MLTLNDGRAEIWQWDTGRTLAVDADCSQVHFSNKVFGRSIDVDVVAGAAIIPDILLQTDKDLNVWAFVGTSENGYTKISKTFKVNRRNKPADYVFTPPDQTTLSELVDRLDKIEESQHPDAIKNAVEDYLQHNPVEAPVQSVNGQTGEVELTAENVGAISQDDLQAAANEALAQAKASGEFDGADGTPGKDGADGQPGKDGTSPVVSVSAITGGHRINITDVNGTKTVDVMDGSDGKNGADGKPGENGTDGYSPTANVTQNDNGATITITDKNGTTTATVTNGKDGSDGNPGADGSPGKDGADGKTAYAYAVEGGYTGTEVEFSAKLAQEKFANPNALTFTGEVTGSYDGSAPLSVEIPSGGGDGGNKPTIIFDSGEITEEVNIIGPIDISKYSRIRIFGKVYPSSNSAGKRALQIYFQNFNKRILCNAGNGKLFDTAGNPVSFLIYLHTSANAISTHSYAGYNAGSIFDDADYAVSAMASYPDGGSLVYSTKYDFTKMHLSAQDDLSTRPFGIGTRIMVIGDE